MKVMILGAAEGQIPFIKICKELGAEVLVVSIQGNYPGFELADKKIFCDTRDKERLLLIAQEEKIDAVLTDQTDVSVPAVAYISEKMGLRGIGYEMSKKFTDKYIMRTAAREAGICVPDFYEVHNLDEAKKWAKQMRFPIISKPVNSSGSRGVHRIDSLNELDEKILLTFKCAMDNRVIIEEYIKGTEYLVDGLAMNHKYINLDLGIKEYFDLEDTYISKMCMFSSAEIIDDEIERRVLSTNKRLVEAFGLEFGITHAEYIYSPEHDNVFLVEIAARGGGVFLSSHLTPMATGIDTNRIVIDYVLNGNICDLEKLRLNRNVSAWKCFSLKPGVICSTRGKSDLLNVEHVTEVFLNDMEEGNVIDEMYDDTGKKGPILFCAKSREECYQSFEQVERILKITTQKDGINSDIIW